MFCCSIILHLYIWRGNGHSSRARLCCDELSKLELERVSVHRRMCEVCLLLRKTERKNSRWKTRRCRILEDHHSINPAFGLTLSTALPFVADGAHAVAVRAGAVAAAKRVDALCDGDIALRSLPAAVTHAGALVVLAVAAAQHRAGRWRKREGSGGGWGCREAGRD